MRVRREWLLLTALTLLSRLGLAHPNPNGTGSPTTGAERGHEGSLPTPDERRAAAGPGGAAVVGLGPGEPAGVWLFSLV